ncbi:MAG: DinB family protein [Bacillota bacterium]
MNSIIQFINIYMNNGPEALGFILFITSFVLLAFFVIILVDLIAKKHETIQARLISKNEKNIYLLRADGKVKRYRIHLPEILDHLNVDQQVEITLSYLAKIPLHITPFKAEESHLISTNQIIRIFDHMYWANTQIVHTLQGVEGDIEKPLRLFAHVLAAEKVWLTRINGKDASTIAIWPDHYSLEDCENFVQENNSGYMHYFKQHTDADLLNVIFYRNSKGDAFNTRVYDILTQVSLHGSYHRGQLAALLRKVGIEPVNTDYITFERQLNDVGTNE